VTADGVLLWDFDGTLGVRQGKWSLVLLEALDSTAPGSGFTRAEIAAELSSGFPWHEHGRGHPELCDPDAWWAHMAKILSHALARLGVSPDTAERAAGLVRSLYPDPAYWRLFDDAAPALDELSGRGWRHVLVSNHVPELEGILASLGIADRFVAIINSAVTGYEKPHREAFRLALAAAGQPKRVWMIGDSLTR
jgi:putative hydrolase of the HAD superfamily